MQINLILLAAAFITHGTSWIFRVMRLKTILKDQETKTIKTTALYKINFAGYALNILLPFKLGDIARIYWFHTNEKLSLKSSAITVILTRIFDVLGLSIIGLLSIALLTMAQKQSTITQNYIIILSAFTITITLLLSSKTQKLITQLIGKKSKKLADIIKAFKISKTCRLKSTAYSIMIWTVDGLCTYLILKSFIENIPIYIPLLGLVAANIIRSFPTTPGAIGFYEGAMTAVLISFGIDPGIALVTATLDHMVKNITTLTFGIPAITTYKYSTKDLQTLSKKIFQKNNKAQT